MLRSSFTTTLLGLIGITLLLGIAPGCDGDGGTEDIASRFIAAQDSIQQAQCTCAVAAGDYASQEECIAEEFKTEPLGDEACLAQVIVDYPGDVPAIECELANVETLAACLTTAACEETAIEACIQGSLVECPEISSEGDAAGEACFNLSGDELATLLVASRGAANDAFCACAGDAAAQAACLATAENYGEVCSAQVVADHADGAELLACEIEEWDFYADCIDDVVACDVDEIGFCGDSRDAFLGFCADDAQTATNDALAACVE